MPSASLPMLSSCEEDLTSSRPDLAEPGFRAVRKTSSMASFSLSCLIGLKIVTYLHHSYPTSSHAATANSCMLSHRVE